MSAVKAVIFDFDGVVADTESLYDTAERELFAVYGIEISAGELLEIKGLSEKIFLDLLQKKYQINAPLNEIKDQCQTILRRIFVQELDYMPGFLSFYESVKMQFKIGMVTSSSRDLLEWIFANTPVRNLFHTIITTEDTERGKPYPDPYLKMCQLLEVLPENAIVIEDSVNGLRSAKAAGTITIGFLSSFAAADLAEADYLANDYSDLRLLLSNIVAGRKI